MEMEIVNMKTDAKKEHKFLLNSLLLSLSTPVKRILSFWVVVIQFASLSTYVEVFWSFHKMAVQSAL
jgi:hypothetical protein